MFNSTSHLLIAVGMPIQEAKAEIEKNPVNSEAKINKYPIKFKVIPMLLYFLFIDSFSSIYTM